MVMENKNIYFITNDFRFSCFDGGFSFTKTLHIHSLMNKIINSSAQNQMQGNFQPDDLSEEAKIFVREKLV